jgi:hypothetical protein
VTIIDGSNLRFRRDFLVKYTPDWPCAFFEKAVDALPTSGNIFLPMDRNSIERELMEAIREVQELSGHMPVPIDKNTCPINDLEHFDSLRGVETTFLLSAKLKCEFKSPKGEINVFVSKDARRALTVGEIVDRLVELCQ